MLVGMVSIFYKDTVITDNRLIERNIARIINAAIFDRASASVPSVKLLMGPGRAHFIRFGLQLKTLHHPKTGLRRQIRWPLQLGKNTT